MPNYTTPVFRAIVSDFLSRLPSTESADELSPIVRRLRGAAGSLAAGDKEDHRDYLWKKYGEG